MRFQEAYTANPVGVNGTLSITGDNVGGFLCTTAGTATLVEGPPSNRVIFSAQPVTAGVYTPMPFQLNYTGGVFTLAGGASGVLGT